MDPEFDSEEVPRIHPEFRVVGLCTIKDVEKSTEFYSNDLLNMFSILFMDDLTSEAQMELLSQALPNVPKSVILFLGDLNNALRTEQSKSSPLRPLSTRELLRLSRLACVDSDRLREFVNSLLLARFWNLDDRKALDRIMDDCGFPNTSKDPAKTAISETSTDVSFGGVVLQKDTPERPELVPQPLFHNITSQEKILREIALAQLSNEKSLLFIGNQGVGKNKLVDKFLSLMNMEREYVQLHRDSTVQSLTLSPSLNNGLVTYEDSPLLKVSEITECE